MSRPDATMATLPALAGNLANGRVSAREVYEAVAQRHAAYGEVSHAYAAWADDAMAQAALADAVIASGVRAESLHGIPVSAKDLFGVVGMPVYAGTRRRLPVAWEREGSLVAAIRRQRGIIVGKTRTTEFALSALGINPYGPSVRNPWDRQGHRSAGGSSSGAGASIAEGSALLALGTDTLGSVRIPASVTGVVGIKTSIGRWPTDGVVPLSPTFDTIGLLARTVLDAAYGFAALDPAGYRWEPFLESLGNVRPAELRIGIVEAGFRDCEPSIAAAVHSALDQIARAGATLCPVSLPEAGEAFAFVLDSSVAVAEFDAFVAHELPDWRGIVRPAVAALADRGAQASARQYLADRRRHAALARQAADRFGDLTVIAMPTVPVPPPRLDSPLAPDEARQTHLAMLRNSCVANCLRLCAVTLPVGLDRQGLPVGMELLGRHGGEERLLAAALAVERALGTGSERIGTPPLLQ
jgi:aspartyl-tRNA(Asn)/glutamyl-tRNA(Gln) amidotransferase subunit A